MGEPWLNRVARGGVVFEAVVAFDRDLAGFHVQDHLAEASTIILVAVGNQSLKLFLQVRRSRLSELPFLRKRNPQWRST